MANRRLTIRRLPRFQYTLAIDYGRCVANGAKMAVVDDRQSVPSKLQCFVAICIAYSTLRFNAIRFLLPIK